MEEHFQDIIRVMIRLPGDASGQHWNPGLAPSTLFKEKSEKMVAEVLGQIQKVCLCISVSEYSIAGFMKQQVLHKYVLQET